MRNPFLVGVLNMLGMRATLKSMSVFCCTILLLTTCKTLNPFLRVWTDVKRTSYVAVKYMKLAAQYMKLAAQRVQTKEFSECSCVHYTHFYQKNIVNEIINPTKMNAG